VIAALGSNVVVPVILGALFRILTLALAVINR